MVVTTETATEKERRYGIGYRSMRYDASATKVEEDTKIENARNEEDGTVTITAKGTLPMHKIQARKVEEPVEIKNATAVTLKSKIMLGVYMLVALVLSVVVAITGLVLGQNAAQLNGLENKVDAANAAINAQQVQMNELAQEGAILDKATTNGMSEAAQANTVELIPMGESAEYSANTNFFDQLCDWLGAVIGG